MREKQLPPEQVLCRGIDNLHRLADRASDKGLKRMAANYRKTANMLSGVLKDFMSRRKATNKPKSRKSSK
jgi:hypothetical protein